MCQPLSVRIFHRITEITLVRLGTSYDTSSSTPYKAITLTLSSRSVIAFITENLGGSGLLKLCLRLYDSSILLLLSKNSSSIPSYRSKSTMSRNLGDSVRASLGSGLFRLVGSI